MAGELMLSMGIMLRTLFNVSIAERIGIQSQAAGEGEVGVQNVRVLSAEGNAA